MGFDSYKFHTGEFLTYDLCMRGGELVEKIFQTRTDPTQEPVTREQINWIYTSIPECNTVVTVDDMVVADAFVVPITSRDAKRFVTGLIGEPELLTIARTTDKQSCDALYLCSVAVDPAYRGYRFGSRALVRSVDCARSRLTERTPLLVAWPWNAAGRKIAEYVARDQNLVLVVREN